MTDYGLVSIITPSYNSASFIGETIESVLAQTYTHWELIFQDDCSTDNTYTIVSNFANKDSRIKYECNTCNSGAAVSRNNALRRAQGRWIAFLDSDDLWQPNKLELQVKFMVENGYAFSYTQYQEIDETGLPLGVLVSGPKQITNMGMLSYCWPGCLTVMYDALKIGLIQIVDIAKNNDYAMWLKISKQQNCYLLSDCFAFYRKRSGSISNHGYISLIKWHYKLFRNAEKKGRLQALLFTFVNIICGEYKKVV